MPQTHSWSPWGLGAPNQELFHHAPAPCCDLFWHNVAMQYPKYPSWVASSGSAGTVPVQLFPGLSLLCSYQQCLSFLLSTNKEMECHNDQLQVWSYHNQLDGRHVGLSIVASLYNDEIAISHISQSMFTVECHIQIAINHLSQWALRSEFTFSTGRTQCVHFTRLRGLDPPADLFINSRTLPFAPAVKSSWQRTLMVTTLITALCSVQMVT
jgi:hypothetical protein